MEEEEEEGEATIGEMGVGGEVAAVKGGVGARKAMVWEEWATRRKAVVGLRGAALVAVAPRQQR